MSFAEAIALSPQWVQLWLNWMLFAVFILPFALFIWKPSRKIALISLIASGLAGAGIQLMFAQMGYVRLLGLPHLIFWTPLAVYLFGQVRQKDLPQLARGIIWVMLATIAVSLAFDAADTLRWLLGERGPMVGRA